MPFITSNPALSPIHHTVVFKTIHKQITDSRPLGGRSASALLFHIIPAAARRRGDSGTSAGRQRQPACDSHYLSVYFYEMYTLYTPLYNTREIFPTIFQMKVFLECLSFVWAWFITGPCGWVGKGMWVRYYNCWVVWLWWVELIAWLTWALKNSRYQCY